MWSFTPRELEFIELRYGQAKGLKEIAFEMGITTRTAQFHSGNVLKKLGIDTSSEDGSTSMIRATKRLIELGLITSKENNDVSSTCLMGSTS